MPPIRAQNPRTRPGPYNLRPHYPEVELHPRTVSFIDLSGEDPPDLPKDVWTHVAERLDPAYFGSFKMVSTTLRDAVYPVIEKMNLAGWHPPLLPLTDSELKKTPIAAMDFIHSENGSLFVIKNWPSSYFAALMSFENGQKFNLRYWPAFFKYYVDAITPRVFMDFALFRHAENFESALEIMAEKGFLLTSAIIRPNVLKELMGMKDQQYIKKLWKAVYQELNFNPDHEVCRAFIEAAVEMKHAAILKDIVSFYNFITWHDLAAIYNLRNEGTEAMELVFAEHLPDTQILHAKIWALENLKFPLYEELCRRNPDPVFTDADLERLALSPFRGYIRAIEKYAALREKKGYRK